MAVAKRRLNKPKLKKSYVKPGRRTATRGSRSSKLTAQFVEQMVYAAPSIRQMQDHNPKYYALVIAESAEILVREVQVRMNDGWAALGGIALSPSGQFCQAVVRYC